MKIYDTDFSDERLGSVFDAYEEKADSVFTDNEKTQSLLDRIKALGVKLTHVPVIGKYVDDMLDLAEMISDYREGIYTALPKKSIVAVAALLIYLASPIDLIPDAIPVVGWLDDAAVIAFAYKAGVQKDLEAYREWKAQNIITDGDVIDCRGPEE